MQGKTTKGLVNPTFFYKSFLARWLCLWENTDPDEALPLNNVLNVQHLVQIQLNIVWLGLLLGGVELLQLLVHPHLNLCIKSYIELNKLWLACTPLEPHFICRHKIFQISFCLQSLLNKSVGELTSEYFYAEHSCVMTKFKFINTTWHFEWRQIKQWYHLMTWKYLKILLPNVGVVAMIRRARFID